LSTFSCVSRNQPPPLRIVVTEFNVMARAGPLHLTWLHALFVTATVLNLLAVPQVSCLA